MKALVIKYEYRFNYFDTPIIVDYFGKYLRKIFTDISIIDFDCFDKFKVIDITIKTVQVDIHEY